MHRSQNKSTKSKSINVWLRYDTGEYPQPVGSLYIHNKLTNKAYFNKLWLRERLDMQARRQRMRPSYCKHTLTLTLILIIDYWSEG